MHLCVEPYPDTTINYGLFKPLFVAQTSANLSDVYNRLQLICESQLIFCLPFFSATNRILKCCPKVLFTEKLLVKGRQVQPSHYWSASINVHRRGREAYRKSNILGDLLYILRSNSNSLASCLTITLKVPNFCTLKQNFYNLSPSLKKN